MHNHSEQQAEVGRVFKWILRHIWIDPENDAFAVKHALLGEYKAIHESTSGLRMAVGLPRSWPDVSHLRMVKNILEPLSSFVPGGLGATFTISSSDYHLPYRMSPEWPDELWMLLVEATYGNVFCEMVQLPIATGNEEEQGQLAVARHHNVRLVLKSGVSGVGGRKTRLNGILEGVQE
ncbi:hypothetical protein DL769_004264 [Monosporascus sp. CRB-8-3]|nr:hypothetical protein DL769_004264 [Monosporascus sp. CRB-8-3]